MPPPPQERTKKTVVTPTKLQHNKRNKSNLMPGRVRAVVLRAFCEYKKEHGTAPTKTSYVSIKKITAWGEQLRAYVLNLRGAAAGIA